MVKPFKSKAQFNPQPQSTHTHVFNLMVALDDYVIDGINEPSPQVMEAIIPALMTALCDKKRGVKTSMRLVEFMDKSDVCPDPILLELRS